MRWSTSLLVPVELALYMLLITGLMITEYTQVPWDVKRWALTVHIAAAIVLFPLVIAVFWALHRGNLSWSRKSFNRRTGRVIELCLIVMFLCGLWLLFIGEDRTKVGEIAHVVHLLTALPLVGFMLWHAWRLSLVHKALKLIGVASALALLLGLPGPRGQAFAEDGVGKPSPAAYVSRSLTFSPDTKTLYSANFEAGSVSKIDRKSGKILAERALGEIVKTVALTQDGAVLAATDYEGDKLYLLEADDLSVIETVALPGRPYGVAYDPDHDFFWMTASEGNRLYAVDRDGEVRQTVQVGDSPRGLARLPDGRLLVTHLLTGKISIYDASALPPKLTKTITLAASHDPTPTVSQGVPRVLDRIVLSPDLKQAWLPHHLWNFDHPFQFQSLVFPALSVLWLEKGKEQEIVSRRKELFNQINIVESGNIQRIVSNPFDAAFSSDGEKVYATMAGSEDLVVFDLSRAPPLTGADDTNSGANASQIMALPGDNPRGIVLDGSDIFVQNAMSLDLTSLSSGGGGPFAELSVTKPSFAKLVAKDPLDPQLRRGLRLFNLAKTDAIPDAPMAGDNWMSCNSCHIDGFNFTNRELFRDTKRTLAQDAVPGHFSLKAFIAGDFVAEYLRMIRNTQGGMGADTRFPTPETDPENPPEKVAQMMKDLHTYVTSPGNLPNFSTWLTGDGGHATVDATNWLSPAICGECHSQIFEEWAGSMHHLMGVSNPYYMVAEDMAAEKVGEEFRVWCKGCHMPEVVLSGKAHFDGPSRLFDKDPAGTMVAELRNYVHMMDEGTGCLTCHRTDKLQLISNVGGGNASIDINLKDRETYPGEASKWPAVRWLAERAIRAEPDEHVASFQPAVLKDPVFCSGCHNEFTPGVGAVTTSTYTEWKESPFNAPDNPAAHRSCADCHMHADVKRIGEPIAGFATDDGPLKKNVKSHSFVGAQYHLLGLRSADRKQATINLLKTSATLDLSVDDQSQLVVRVTNVGAGHNLPTGVSDFRQLWLQITVTDANGNQVLKTGALAPDGTLDPNARLFRNAFGDHSANILGVDFFEYRKLIADTRIPAGGHRDEAFALPADTAFPIQVDARLMFRTFPQSLTDAVRKRYPKMPAPEAVELNHLAKTLGGT